MEVGLASGCTGGGAALKGFVGDFHLTPDLSQGRISLLRSTGLFSSHSLFSSPSPRLLFYVICLKRKLKDMLCITFYTSERVASLVCQRQTECSVIKTYTINACWNCGKEKKKKEKTDFKNLLLNLKIF